MVDLNNNKRNQKPVLSNRSITSEINAFRRRRKDVLEVFVTKLQFLFISLTEKV